MGPIKNLLARQHFRIKATLCEIWQTYFLTQENRQYSDAQFLLVNTKYAVVISLKFAVIVKMKVKHALLIVDCKSFMVF